MYELLTNARFLTPDGVGHPASTLLTFAGRIVGLDPAEIPSQAKRIDLGNTWALPGLIDAHLHLFWIGEQLYRYVDLAGATTIEELLSLLRERAREQQGSEPERWVLGRGFDQEKLRERRFPTREELDQALPGKRVVITRVCGHAGVASSAALGETVNETGLLLEGELWTFLQRIPAMSDAELETAAMLAMNLVASRGFTGVGTILEEPRQFSALARLRQKGPLPVRVTAHFPGAAAEAFHRVGLLTGVGDEWLRLGAAKFFSDGTLGARTALLSEPYSDGPGQCGLAVLGREEMLAKFRDAHDKGFQIAVHAIGDLALKNCIDALEPLCSGGNPRRHRIEHVSLCPDEELGRLAKLGILAVVQPQFARSDSWIPERVGGRARWAYRFGRLAKAGVRLALSSDAPVESPDPGDCLAAALRPSAWHTEEPLTLEQALTAYSHGAAFAGGMDGLVGSLTEGKLADLTLVHSPAIEGKPEWWRTVRFSAQLAR